MNNNMIIYYRIAYLKYKMLEGGSNKDIFAKQHSQQQNRHLSINQCEQIA